jgi:pimeloyl-ACP methyl ester carboxylesterase
LAGSRRLMAALAFSAAYGASDRDPERRVVSCVGDVAAIADALGIERFAVTGGSGSGPHALRIE